MQVSVDSTGPIERRVNIQIGEEQITAEVQKRLKDLARSARIAGFRPGKAPFKVVEQRYAARVRDDVVGEQLRDSFRAAVVGQNLRPAGDPTIDPFSAAPGTGLTYSATFEVYPEVTLDKVRTLAIEKPVCQVTDTDVENMIETLRRQAREWVEVARPAASGDRLVVDYHGFVDEAALEGGHAHDFEIELGSGMLIPGFEDGLIGASAGEKRTLNLSFPEGYQRTELAGKPVRFEVEVKTVKQGELPTLDDAFFERFGVKSGGFDAFRTEVRGNMEREMQRKLRERLHSGIMQRLFEQADFAVPRALITSESERLVEGMRQRLAMQGANREMLAAMKPELAENEARRRVTLGLVIAEVIRANELKADPALVRARVESLAASYEDPKAVVKWYFEDGARLREVEGSVLEDAALDWVLNQASVTEQPLSFDALMNPGQTG